VSDETTVPVSATVDLLTRDVVVTFNNNLTSADLDRSNWYIVIRGDRFNASPGVRADGNRVTFTHDGIPIPDPADEVVTYLAAPPDLLDISSRPVATFNQRWTL
jgi:hypothetical protein